MRIWLGLSIFSVSSLDSFVSKGCKSWILVWVVLWVGWWGSWLGLVWTFSWNPKYFNESCLVVWKLIFFGVIYCRFGPIVLSKVKVLLVLLLVVYFLSRDVLDIIGCHLVVRLGEWFWWMDGLIDFPSTVVVKDEYELLFK